MRTDELTGPALDWAVAKCEGRIGTTTRFLGGSIWDDLCEEYLHYATDWEQGGPIIEGEVLSTWWNAEAKTWSAADKKWMTVDADSDEFMDMPNAMQGPTPLIAAMRCYVASKLGDEVEIPDELR